MIRMGCPPDLAEQYRKPPATDFIVEPDAWQVLRLFLSAQTQWNMLLGMGGIVYVGLNYQSVMLLLKMYPVDDEQSVFAHLQAMEAAALQILNARE